MQNYKCLDKGSGEDRSQFVYDSYCLSGVAGIGEDGIEAFSLECVDFLFAEAVGDSNYLCVLEVRVGPGVGAELCSVDIAGHEVYHDDVRQELLCDDSGVKAVMCGFDFAVFFLSEGVCQDFGRLVVAVYNKNSDSSGLKDVGRHVVVFHELDEFGGGDSPVS